MAEVDVIIPVYKPTDRLFRLLDQLAEQTVPVHSIILINTGKKYFDEFVSETDLEERYGNIRVRHVTEEEFDHGATRNYGVSLSDTPFFVMMTDDALPYDKSMICELLKPFSDEQVGMSYARQLPGEGCGVIESYTRSFNYPAQPCVKSAQQLESMGIKAFFASNVCAAYRREIFDRQGGFISHTIFNEDMIYARGLLDQGYRIAYVPEAKVAHSHNYSGLEQLRRNFDMGISHVEHPEVFAGLSAESEGIRLVWKTCTHLMAVGKSWLIIRLIWLSGCKYVGYFLGKRYRKLPLKAVKMLSMNKNFWKK